MLIALIGPSCSGKSHCLNLMRDYMGFEVPTGITTRPLRSRDDGVLDHITLNDFDALLSIKKLCLVDEAFGYLYAYPFPLVSSDVNVAVEIRRNNIDEAREIGGFIIKILPYSLQIGLEKIAAERSESLSGRIEELKAEYLMENEPGFDLVFKNRFDQESSIYFLEIISNLIMEQKCITVS